MAEGFNIDWRDFDTQIVRQLATTGRGALPVLVEQGRGIIRGVMSVTPPGKPGVDGLSTTAREHGKSTIASDLLGGGSRNKNHRTGGIFSPMPRGILAQAEAVHGGTIERLFTRKDGTVFGVERDYFRPDATQSEMRAHHKKYFKGGRFTRAGGATRDIGRWKFIDKLVIPEETFRAYLREQHARVGYLLSGWRVAAKKLGLAIPAWIANADGPSMALIVVTADRLRITATNEVRYASTRITERRIQWAIDQQAKKMERRWNHYIERRFK